MHTIDLRLAQTRTFERAQYAPWVDVASRL